MATQNEVKPLVFIRAWLEFIGLWIILFIFLLPCYCIVDIYHRIKYGEDYSIPQE